MAGRTGAQLAAELERIAHRVGVTARYMRETRGWSDLASRHGAAVRAHGVVLNVGCDPGRPGALSAGPIDPGRGRSRCRAAAS